MSQLHKVTGDRLEVMVKTDQCQPNTYNLQPTVTEGSN